MSNSTNSDVKIVEVGPRDGLQNEKVIISTSDKLEYINLLAQTGLQTIEATSFVSKKAIPQMGDAKELFKQLDLSKANFPCLVPNMIGLENAIEVGVKEIAVFTATSNEFNLKNINANIDESLDRIEDVTTKALMSNIKIRGYVSTVCGCPYEGKTSIDKLKEVCERLFRMGCYEISLGDTIGVGKPEQVRKIILELQKEFDRKYLAMHFHDTYKNALDNIKVSIEEGIKTFDSSSGGLGGCPYAKGATGNVATEDVIDLLDSLNVSHNIDMKKLEKASKFILEKVGKKSPARHYKK